MKLLKNKEDIIGWLEGYGVKEYELIESKQYGFMVNVNTDVDLKKQKLTCIEVKFNHIDGWFDCSENELRSLLGCPNSTNGSFYCDENKLLSLMHGPTNVGKHYYCTKNELSNLLGSARIVGEDFDCSNNNLISLGGCPEIVGGFFACEDNKIENLVFFPKEIKGAFYGNNNPALNDLVPLIDVLYQEHHKQVIEYNQDRLREKIEIICVDNNIFDNRKRKI